MVFGYCRISTSKQNIERQERNILAKFPHDIIYKEIYTGTTKTGRKMLERILSKVRAGDTIVFDSVSRMSRNADEGIKLYMELYQKDISLVFLKEQHINTDTYRSALSRSIDLVGNPYADIYIKATNEVLMLLAKDQIRLAFEQSQKEVSDLRQRTAEGIETARRNGKQIGQTPGRKLEIKKKPGALEIIQRHAREFGGTLTDNECMKLAGVSRGTYFKYKRELKEKE